MKKVVTIVLILFLIFFFLLFNPWRYKITGTNQGAIYKTDRLTGNTTLITTNGEERLVEIIPPAPTTTPQYFDLSALIIDSVNGEVANNQFRVFGTVKNQSSNNPACNLVFEITYQRDGKDIETDYQSIQTYIQPGGSKEYRLLYELPYQLKNSQFEYLLRISNAYHCN